MRRFSLISLFSVCFIAFSIAKESTQEFVIKNASYTFELLPLSPSGFHKGGSASGPKMIQVIGKPDQVFKQVWPEYVIKSEWDSRQYSLRLTSAEKEINASFLNEVLDELITTYPEQFSIGTKSIEFNCMKLEDETLLNSTKFNSNQGIEKLIAHKNNSVELKGLTLSEIAEWITENTEYSFGFIGVQDEIVEVNINLLSAKTIACSLEKIGISSAVCYGKAKQLILLN